MRDVRLAEQFTSAESPVERVIPQEILQRAATHTEALGHLLHSEQLSRHIGYA